ncbi:MAG TPA: hypothetical protein VNT26_16575, partial [Candidatus Sulfotelmatobacter sp.]|nr:hypothetical protein [Candidatus Sulfotelmatobacter sp.]
MNQLRRVLTLCAMFLAASCPADLAIEKLRCEYLVNPLGIDAAHPRLSWILASSGRAEKQSAYQILVASTPQRLDKDQGDLWDSGKMESDETCQIAYQGSPLRSRESCFWKVRAWDRAGKPSQWSAQARWQMGLLGPQDWSARWIEAPAPTPAGSGRLVIRRAIYEAVEGSGSADVTSVVAACVKDNRLHVAVNNQVLGRDPALNQLKRL